MKKISNVMWGIVFIIIGLIFGLNALEIADIDIFFDGWWTLFIIVPCFIDLFKDDDKTGNIIGIVIGVVLLLCCQNILSFELVGKLLLPTILVLIGVSFLFKDTINKRVKREIKKIGNTNNVENDYCATFGGQDINFHNEEFKGCNLTAVFGGINCDLRGSIIKEDVVINVSVIFGGIDIHIPEDVNIKVVSTPIFGGVSNKKNYQNDSKNKTIYIQATCIFGGVEIK